jgi:hypothetical protein
VSGPSPADTTLLHTTLLHLDSNPVTRLESSLVFHVSRTWLGRHVVSRLLLFVVVALCSSSPLVNEEREADWVPSPRSSQGAESRRGHFGRTHHLPNRVFGAINAAPASHPLALLVTTYHLDVEIRAVDGAPPPRPPDVALGHRGDSTTRGPPRLA